MLDIVASPQCPSVKMNLVRNALIGLSAGTIVYCVADTAAKIFGAKSEIAGNCILAVSVIVGVSIAALITKIAREAFIEMTPYERRQFKAKLLTESLLGVCTGLALSSVVGDYVYQYVLRYAPAPIKDLGMLATIIPPILVETPLFRLAAQINGNAIRRLAATPEST